MLLCKVLIQHTIICFNTNATVLVSYLHVNHARLSYIYYSSLGANRAPELKSQCLHIK